MNDRYEHLLATGRRKITREDGEPVYLILIDEYAYFSATVGSKHRPRELRRPDPRPGSPGPRGRRHHRPGHPAALPPGHRPVDAGPVLLPVGVPLHHRLLLRHRCSARAGPPKATPPPTSTRSPAASAGCYPRPACRAGSRPPTSPTTDIKYLAAYAARLRGQARRHEQPSARPERASAAHHTRPARLARTPSRTLDTKPHADG